MKKKCWFMFVIAVLLCNMLATTVKAESDIQPYYSMIMSIHGACYIQNGTLNLSGAVSSDVSTYARVTITLQGNTGSGWKPYGSWSSTGTTSARKFKKVPAKEDTLYRLKITGYVSNSTESESDTIYSKVVSL